MNPLFTIGHSTHSIEAFLQLLASHRIEAIADVRSTPHSRHAPWFSEQPLKQSLRSRGIHYVPLSREFGAHREEHGCYVGDRVSFDLVADSPAFAGGIARLKEGVLTLRIALLCAEKDPLDCHRTILVARHARRFSAI